MKFLIFLLIWSSLAFSVEFKNEEEIKDIAGDLIKEEMFFRTRLKLLQADLKLLAPNLDPWPRMEEQYQEALKTNEKLKKYDFYRLGRFFKKFIVKSWKAHPDKVDTYEIDLDSEVDSLGLKLWANALVENKTGKRLVLINLSEYEGFDWTVHQVSQEDFEYSFLELWLKHLREFDLSSVNDIELCRDECLVQYQEWKNQKPEELSKEGNGNFSNSIIFEMKLTIKKTQIKTLLPQNKLSIEGGVILLDGSNKKILFHRDLALENRTYSLKGMKDINSAFATQIYKFPSGLMPEIKKSLLNMSKLQKWSLKIIGAKSLSEVIKLKDWITLKYLTKGGQVNLESFSQSQTQLEIQELGEEKINQDRISSLKELESILGRTCLISDEASHYQLKCDP